MNSFLNRSYMIAAPVLPAEIWHAIMLSDSRVYIVMVLTCRYFRINIDVAQSALTRASRTLNAIEYRLPCGYLHRGNDLPAVMYDDGVRIWYRGGAIHRDNDRPAVVAPSYQEWYQYGELHRDGGRPAIIYASGMQTWVLHNCVYRSASHSDDRLYFPE